MKKAIAILIVLLQFGFLQAQHKLTGKVVDSDSEAMIGATVVLIDQDSSMVSFALTNNDGQYRLDDIEKGDYIIQVTYVAHANFSQAITTDWAEKLVNIDPIVLSESSQILQEITIKAEHIPMGIRGDTISYNASAFKTKTNATVEDLLRKLPGIDVERDGTIVAQGKKVDKITVDGKDFFGSNTTLATQNIEAKAVDKVEVFDKKSEEATFTGVEDGKDEKTLNLKLKEEYKKGGFGNAYVAGGTEETYQAKTNYFRFSPKMQASLIFSANNINEQTFSWNDKVDFLGGFSNAMSSSLMGGYTEGVRDGINSSLTTGINLNYDLTKDLKFTSFYFYNLGNVDLQKTKIKETFTEDFSYKIQDTLTSLSDSEGHRANIKLTYNISPTLKATIKTDMNWTDKEASRERSSSYIKNLLDHGDAHSDNSNIKEATNSVSNFFINKNFLKKGRSMKASLAYTDITNRSFYFVKNTNRIVDNYYDINQFQVNDNHQKKIRTGMSYTEPLKNKFYLNFDYYYNHNIEKPIKDFYDISGQESTLNTDLSNVFENLIISQNMKFSVKKASKALTLEFGVKGQLTQLDGLTSNPVHVIKNSYRHIAPTFDVDYKIKQGSSIGAYLSTYIRTPTLYQLQPSLDNTNSNLIYIGNPNLKPSQDYYLSANYNKWDQFSFTNVWSRIHFTKTKDRIVNKISIDENLVQTRTPINTDDYYGLGGNLNYSRPFKPLKIKYSISLRYKYTNYDSYINELNSNIQEQEQKISFKIDNRNKDKVSVQSGISFSRNTRAYKINNKYNQKYYNTNYFLDVEYYLPKGWTIASDFTYYQYANSTFEDNPSYIIWSGVISKLFLDDKLEIRLTAKDLLNQNIGYKRTTSINSYEESYYNNLGRYYMIGVNYKIGKKKEKG